MKEKEFEALLATCMAVSLYQFNVSPYVRAEKLYTHFDGGCAEIDDLRMLVDSKNWATEMAAPTALVYLTQALARYGDEAIERTRVNLMDSKEFQRYVLGGET